MGFTKLNSGLFGDWIFSSERFIHSFAMFIRINMHIYQLQFLFTVNVGFSEDEEHKNSVVENPFKDVQILTPGHRIQ